MIGRWPSRGLQVMSCLSNTIPQQRKLIDQQIAYERKRFCAYMLRNAWFFGMPETHKKRINRLRYRRGLVRHADWTLHGHSRSNAR